VVDPGWTVATGRKGWEKSRHSQPTNPVPGVGGRGGCAGGGRCGRKSRAMGGGEDEEEDGRQRYQEEGCQPFRVLFIDASIGREKVACGNHTTVWREGVLGGRPRIGGS